MQQNNSYLIQESLPDYIIGSNSNDYYNIGYDNDAIETKIHDDVKNLLDEFRSDLSTSIDDVETKVGVKLNAIKENVNTVESKIAAVESKVDDLAKFHTDDDDDAEKKLENPEISSCPSFQNSDTWLNSPRLSNINEKGMTLDAVQSLVMDVSPLDTVDGSEHVLSQSICLKGSNLLTWEDDLDTSISTSTTTTLSAEEEMMEEDVIKSVTFRLLYLALHDHQHKGARKEVLSRYRKEESCIDDKKNTNVTELESKNVGKFDFECPDTKYIVTLIGDIGFGAALRIGAMDPYFLGLVSDRTVLVMNTLSKDIIDNGGFNRPLKLAGCERKDMQCVFMPSSPCVITMDDLSKAPNLSPQELKEFRSKGVLQEKYANEKVIIVEPSLNGHKPLPFGLQDALVNKISSLYAQRDDNSSTPKPWELNKAVLEKVYKFIREKGATQWIFHHLIYLYILRPNVSSRATIDKTINKVIPDNFNPGTAIGLPIRGTDKCVRESECLTFDQYMQVLQEFSIKRSKAIHNAEGDESDELIHNTVILTTESKDILNSRLRYSPKNESFPYEWIVNEEDVGQGSGNPNTFTQTNGENSFDADDVMISSMVSLQMQLYSDALIVNTCSNFHALIQTLVGAGCGRVSYVESMKDNDNPDFRLKCAW